MEQIQKLAGFVRKIVVLVIIITFSIFLIPFIGPVFLGNNHVFADQKKFKVLFLTIDSLRAIFYLAMDTTKKLLQI